ncbi:MAG: allantoinase AllB [Candidatus Bathyarchaeota archaeon]|nr:MAG: allantoinase AllB [Candidatus Bathyarchaeota archaeon]
MPTIDLVIKNGKLVTSNGIFEAGLGVNEGKIIIIAKEANLPKADRSIDANGNLVLPGLIDAHVHFREPGKIIREDFETGTKAAAAGGVTTIFEMPISTPCVSNSDILERKKTIVKKKSLIDFGLYAGAGMHNIDKITELATAGAIGFKTFMHAPPKGREIEYEGAYTTNDGSLLEIFETTGSTGLISSIHAENNAIINILTNKLKRIGRKDALAHPESRPNFVEAEAISKVITLAKAAGVHLHIAHLSTSEGLHLIARAKASGQEVTTETCPHYLVLNTKAMKKLGPLAKINPPLRSKKDMEELWIGLNNRTIDIIASDHAPYTKEEKESGRNDIWKAPSGTPAIETMLPLLLHKVNEGKLFLDTLIKDTSERVAKIFRVYPKKGIIQVGSDADFVIVNLNLIKNIDREKMYSKARDLIPYDGWKIKGWPIMTIVRGEIIMKEEAIFGKPGYGDFISPSMHDKKPAV